MYSKLRQRISWTEVDEPWVCYTEWSKSEREKQILYINAYTWNLGKWDWWAYGQGRNRDADIEKRFVDTVGEGEGGMNWECSIKTYVLPSVKQRASGTLHNTGSSNQCSETSWRGGMAGEGGRPKREVMYVYLWMIHAIVWQKPTQHCKAIIRQLKKKKKNYDKCYERHLRNFSFFTERSFHVHEL